MNILFSSEWQEPGKKNSVEDWKYLFQTWKTSERRIMDNSGPFSTQRIHIDLNSFRYPDEDTFQNQVNLLLDKSKCHIGEV